MGLLRLLKEVFESIFLSSSPEVKKRMEMRKIESELKILPSQIFKNGLLQPNFAELIRILYENTKPIDTILSNTLCSPDIQRNGRFEYELIATGFDAETQDRLENLEYENRKQAVMESDSAMNKIIDSQRRSMENILKHLNSPAFLKIDETLSSLRQLADICHFSYISIIHLFDQNFDGLASSSLGLVTCLNSPVAAEKWNTGLLPQVEI